MSISKAKRFDFGGEIVWRPSPEVIANSNLTRFMKAHGLSSLEELQRRSITDLDWFWNAVLKDLDIRFRQPYSRILDLSRGIAWPEWCVGGVMNIVDNCLDKYASTTIDSKPAILWEGEEGQTRRLSYLELRREVNCMGNALRGLGLGKGDVIGVLMPMTPEIVVAMLAIIKIGGIFLPLFSGFGPQAIASRLNDAEAKSLFTADGCPRRGKATLLKRVADDAAAQTPTLRHLIVLKRIGANVPWQPGRDLWWHELLPSPPEDPAKEPSTGRARLSSARRLTQGIVARRAEDRRALPTSAVLPHYEPT